MDSRDRTWRIASELRRISQFLSSSFGSYASTSACTILAIELLVDKPVHEAGKAYLLHNLTIIEDVLKGNVKFAKVVLAHAIFVPADSFE